MKYLLSLIVSSSLLFGYTIDFNKSFSQEISNDEITSYIAIYSKNETQNKAINGLSKYKRIMEKFENIKKTNISQNTYPEYRYENSSNKRILEGYKATLNYTISSEDAIEISKYIEELLEIKRDEALIQVTFSNLTYQVSKKKKELAEEKLRLEALLWAKKYSLELSNKLKQSCEINHISIGENSYIRPMTRTYASANKSMAMEVSADVSLPTPADTDISINSSFQFNCK